MKRPSNERPVGLRLSSAEHQRLRVLAAEEDMTMAAVARREVRRYISQRPVSRGRDGEKR
jgi:hypothetical protein